MDWQARESPTLTTLFNAPAFRSKSCFIAGSQMVELRKWRWGHRTGQMVAFLHPEIWGKFSSLLSLWINLQCWASDGYRLYSIADVISDLASYLKYLSIFLTLLLDICQFLECHGTSLCLISYLNGGWGFCRIKKKKPYWGISRMRGSYPSMKGILSNSVTCGQQTTNYTTRSLELGVHQSSFLRNLKCFAYF